MYIWNWHAEIDTLIWVAAVAPWLMIQMHAKPTYRRTTSPQVEPVIFMVSHLIKSWTMVMGDTQTLLKRSSKPEIVVATIILHIRMLYKHCWNRPPVSGKFVVTSGSRFVFLFSLYPDRILRKLITLENRHGWISHMKYSVRARACVCFFCR